MMKEFKQRGDTIVEVLITLAVLGLALSISYASANRSLIQARNAEEHAEALQLISSQIEQIRADSADTSPNSPFNQPTGTDFYMTLKQVDPLPNPQTLVAQAGTNIISSTEGFTESISYSRAVISGTTVQQDIFTVTIKWAGLANLGEQQEQLSYKVHQDTNCAQGGGVCL